MYDQGCVHSHAGTTVARCYYFLLKARCQSQVRYVFQLPPKFYLHPRCGGVVGFNRVPYPVRCRLFCGALICWCGKMLPNVTSKLSRDIVILGLFGQCYHIFSLIFGQFHFLIILGCCKCHIDIFYTKCIKSVRTCGNFRLKPFW